MAHYNPKYPTPHPRQPYAEYDQYENSSSPVQPSSRHPNTERFPYAEHNYYPNQAPPQRHPEEQYSPDQYTPTQTPGRYHPQDSISTYDHQQHPQHYPEAYPDAHQNYPPGSDHYYSHQPHSTLDGYFPEYDDPHGVGPQYDYDEKHPAGHYPPSVSGSVPGRVIGADIDPSINHSNAAFAAPTRGSVAAQMAAEGQIPEKAGLRMWRSDEHSGAFTRGGKGKCCGRCCCCSMIVIALITVGLIAGFLLWVRPPNATFNGIGPPTAGNQVDLQPGGFLLNFDLNIGVTNPNFFGASFSKISAKAFYPGHTAAPLGGGEMSNVQIKPHSNTTINFPFQINYTTALDPNRVILADIANRCGFLGAAKAPIKISFDVTLRLKIMAITISPTFSSSNTFTCPLKQSDFNSVLGGTQSLDALSTMLTGTGTTGNTANPTPAANTNTRKLSRRGISSDIDVNKRISELLAVFAPGTTRMDLSSLNIELDHFPLPWSSEILQKTGATTQFTLGDGSGQDME